MRVDNLHPKRFSNRFDSDRNDSASSRPDQRSGYSLIEVLVALTIISILTSMAVPAFQRAVDQSRADIAGANLRAIWSAERCYWLENRTYTSDLSTLVTLDLLDPAIVSSSTFYSYQITAATSSSFTAKATRIGSSRWSGQFTITQAGTVTGSITASGEVPISPGYQ